MAFVIAIAGPSGSGKSTLAEALGKSVPVHSLVLEVDRYYLDFPDLSAEERARINFDDPSTIDRELLLSHVCALRNGLPIKQPLYDFRLSRRVGFDFERKAPSLIIIEGIFSLYWDELLELVDFTIYVKLDVETSFSRRLCRDLVHRGRTYESVRRQFYDQVLPSFHEYVEPTEAKSDLVLDGLVSTDEMLMIVDTHSALREVFRRAR